MLHPVYTLGLMPNLRGHGILVTSLLLAHTLVAACNDRRGPAPMATSPTAPTISTSPTIPSPAVAGELIRGAAQDSAFRPLAGARVEILNGPQAGTSTTSDAFGNFSLTGTVDDTTQFRASKDGYVTATATALPGCDGCNPRRWIFFYLDVLEPPVDLSGNYTLTFTADSACANLPDELRTRTYDATIRAHTKTSLSVVPSGPAFSDNLSLFYLNVAGNFVNVSLGDHTDPGIAERVAPNTYFAFGGWSTVTVAAPVHTITTPFEGWIDHCVLKAPIGTRYDCTAANTVTFARCQSKKHQLTLTRR